MAKKKGPVLYELLRKDHAEKRWPTPGERLRETPGSVRSQGPSAGDSASQPPASRMDAPEEDRESLVFHLTRTQAAIVAGGIVAALLVSVWIGSRASKPATPADSMQPVASTADVAVPAADVESQQPLAMLLPEPGSDPRPDEPVRVRPAGEIVAPAGVGVNVASAQTPAAEARSGGDPRIPGLNYLVIQIFPDRPDTAEQVESARKFLAQKGIRTIAVPSGSGGVMVMSAEGFNWDKPDDRVRLDNLTETVKNVGKEYVSPKYGGRYDFRAPFAQKYKGR